MRSLWCEIEFWNKNFELWEYYAQIMHIINKMICMPFLTFSETLKKLEIQHKTVIDNYNKN